ncbi:hypothetical protein [Paenibacillus tuaregi]|uniref:hypothetical protein n=1 Tax=Paenibacillus tuaregi TaxID=1816681 RepID=UPI0008380223|nr:hypothetical protein [Paenibacillus tuaregi]
MEKLDYAPNPDLAEALEELSLELSNTGQPWLVGGSCGLWLQGVQLQTAPRDIDVYADLEDTVHLHEVLLPRSMDKQILDKSGMYVSLLSHYRLGSYVLELVGGFEVRSGGSCYQVEVGELLYKHALRVRLKERDIRLMPLCHEFLFNVLRDRPDRYKPIAETINASPESHRGLLREMIGRNRWSKHHLQLISNCLDWRPDTDGI